MRYYRILILILGFWCFQAQADDKYSYVVNVDVTDINAAVAREKAMMQANRQALNNAAPEFTDERGFAILNNLSNEQVSYFIKEATVLEEKSSDVRYLANLKITVRDDILRQYLQEKGVSEELPLTSVDTLYIFTNLSEWIDVQKKIKNIKNVEDVELVAMARQKVQFRIIYRGEATSLEHDVANIGLMLRKSGNIYILSANITAPMGE